MSTINITANDLTSVTSIALYDATASDSPVSPYFAPDGSYYMLPSTDLMNTKYISAFALDGIPTTLELIIKKTTVDTLVPFITDSGDCCGLDEINVSAKKCTCILTQPRSITVEDSAGNKGNQVINTKATITFTYPDLPDGTKEDVFLSLKTLLESLQDETALYTAFTDSITEDSTILDRYNV